jgi:hypothetical protein
MVDQNEMVVCRPQKITCRWLKEITMAINRVCPEQEMIKKCEVDLEVQWKDYVTNLKCQKNGDVRDILEFKTDYNVFLDDYGHQHR